MVFVVYILNVGIPLNGLSCKYTYGLLPKRGYPIFYVTLNKIYKTQTVVATCVHSWHPYKLFAIISYTHVAFTLPASQRPSCSSSTRYIAVQVCKLNTVYACMRILFECGNLIGLYYNQESHHLPQPYLKSILSNLIPSACSGSYNNTQVVPCFHWHIT